MATKRPTPASVNRAVQVRSNIGDTFVNITEIAAIITEDAKPLVKKGILFADKAMDMSIVIMDAVGKGVKDSFQ
jgi:hypothetical protein